MAMNFATLTGAKTAAGSIKRFANYSQIDADQVLEDAQGLLNSLVRTREMIASASLTLGVGASFVALPARFLDPISKYLLDTRNIRYKRILETALESRRCYDANGVLIQTLPSRWAIYDELVQFDAKFDTASTLRILFYQSPLPLGDGTGGTTATTNFFTTRYPHVMRQACVVAAHAFMKNWESHDRELPKLEAMTQRMSVEADLAYRGADFDTELEDN